MHAAHDVIVRGWSLFSTRRTLFRAHSVLLPTARDLLKGVPQAVVSLRQHSRPFNPDTIYALNHTQFRTCTGFDAVVLQGKALNGSGMAGIEDVPIVCCRGTYPSQKVIDNLCA